MDDKRGEEDAARTADKELLQCDKRIQRCVVLVCKPTYPTIPDLGFGKERERIGLRESLLRMCISVDVRLLF